MQQFPRPRARRQGRWGEWWCLKAQACCCWILASIGMHVTYMLHSQIGQHNPAVILTYSMVTEPLHSSPLVCCRRPLKDVWPVWRQIWVGFVHRIIDPFFTFGEVWTHHLDHNMRSIWASGNEINEPPRGIKGPGSGSDKAVYDGVSILPYLHLT